MTAMKISLATMTGGVLLAALVSFGTVPAEGQNQQEPEDEPVQRSVVPARAVVIGLDLDALVLAASPRNRDDLAAIFA